MDKNTKNQQNRKIQTAIRRAAASSKDVLVSISDDPLQGLMTGIILTVFSFLVVLGGLSIWPYIIMQAAQDGIFMIDSVFDKIVLVGMISCGVGLLTATYLCWFYEWDDIRHVSFRRIWLIVFATVMLVDVIGMPLLKVDLLAVGAMDIWTGILSLLVHGLVGIVMAVVPATLIALLGFLVNRMWYMTHKHLL